jgi:hypothetical protein
MLTSSLCCFFRLELWFLQYRSSMALHGI